MHASFTAFVGRLPSQQKQFHLFGTISKQMQVDIRMARCRAIQNRAGKKRIEPLQQAHRRQGLLPQLAQQLAPAFRDGSVQAWTGVRCASADRRPYVGEIEPGLWVSTAMGSRGLTFAALCGELLAARLHGEPLPLEPRLAAALDTARNR